MDIVVKVLVLGFFATIIMDIWATFSNRVLDFPRTNWAMVGRWVGHIPAGKFIHNPVSTSTPIRHEKALGWAFHYMIGTVYAAFYVVFLMFNGEHNASLAQAWYFGLVTMLSPWFILQPALGLGIFAVKAPKPNWVRIQNLATHSVFGVALYCGWLALHT